MSTRPGADVDCEGVQQSAGSVYYPALQQVTGQRAVSREFQACCSTAAVEEGKYGSDTAEQLYRPVSNLPFLSKLLEKVISERLRQHLEKIDGIPKDQSVYRSGHSTETALLKIINDLLSADRGEATVLCLLDLSAAFDTVDHQLLLTRLQDRFGVVGKAYDWFQSYLHGRSYSVTHGSSMSDDCVSSMFSSAGISLGPPALCAVHS